VIWVTSWAVVSGQTPDNSNNDLAAHLKAQVIFRLEIAASILLTIKPDS